MMYELLAQFYDALVQDDEATHDWVELIDHHMHGKDILECACGSGEITIALSKIGYHITGTDISQSMIDEAKKKPGSEAVKWKVMDMCHIKDEHIYDGILCLCDSFNYLLKDQQVLDMLHGIYDHLKEDGIFIMDMHSLDRLSEFEEEYNEAGRVCGHEYQWTIQSIEDEIHQNFAFYDDAGRVILEQHIQRVYDPIMIQNLLVQVGFSVEIYTDFTLKGIQPGEKYFYICKKVKK